MRLVYANLLRVGHALDARDLRMIYDHGIRAVIDLAINEPPAQLGREIIYFRIPLHDGDGNSDALVLLALRTIAWLVESEIPTLVACSAGMSRAPSIAAGAIATLTGRDPDDCLRQLIASAPNDISPILWSQVRRLCKQGG